jgi:type IX secretion system PorP/SprF family membrane protein
MFWNNYSVVNPANSGFDYRHFATVQGRNQWTEYEVNPKTAWVNYDLKIDAINSGSGIYYSYDEFGNLSTNVISINYNYQFTIRENHHLGLGISFGYQEQKMEDNWDPGLPSIIDPLIPGNSTASTYNAAVGLKYRFKKFSFGFSVKNLTEPSYAHGGTHWKFEYPNYRTYYFLSTYSFKLSESFDLEPGILSRYDIIELSMDVNIRSIFKKKVWLGSSLRGNSTNFSAISAMAGVVFWKKMQLGFSTDISTSRLSSYDGGTYEFYLSFALE